MTPAMSHWPFIAASYALGVLIPLVFGIAAFTRMGTARRRLALIDPRGNRPTGSGPVAGSGGPGSQAQRVRGDA
jgi:hypothetical protein